MLGGGVTGFCVRARPEGIIGIHPSRGRQRRVYATRLLPSWQPVSGRERSAVRSLPVFFK